MQGVFDDHGQNFSPRVLTHLGNTQYLLRFRTESGWGSDFGGNGAYSGADISDPSTPTVITHAETLDGGFVLSYSFTAYEPANGITYTHGPVPNHIPSFGTPSWRVFYDRRETPSNMDMDDLLTEPVHPRADDNRAAAQWWFVGPPATPTSVSPGLPGETHSILSRMGPALLNAKRRL